MRRLSAAASILLVACAAPNTPGQGSGAGYTPVVDMQGVDQAQYANDLAACRQYAEQADPIKQMAIGSIAGAIIGAALASQSGLRGRDVDSVAAFGSTAGLSAAAGKGVATQERIMINCMAGRGYRTLDGGSS